MEWSLQLDKTHTSGSEEQRVPVIQGLAGLIVSLLRSVGKARQPAPKQIRLLETLPLNGKRHLMLVEYAGERFLVGGGSESVQTIVRLQAPAELRSTGDVYPSC